MNRLSKKIDLSKVALITAVVAVVYIVGGESSLRGWQPFKLYNEGVRNIKLVASQLLGRKERSWALPEIRYKGDGVVTYDRTRSHDGFTLIQGLFSDGAEIRLIDMEGNIVRKWPTRFFDIWPDPKHVFPDSRIPASNTNTDLHGMWMLNDGSVIFNFSELGSAKMDKCGKVLWTIDRATHHSVTPNPDGTFWIPGKREPARVSDDLVLFDYSREEFLREGGEYEDTLLLVDEGGKILRELSVLGALVKAGFEHHLFDLGRLGRNDPTHVNDIEVVTEALAKKIQGVKAGDLIVSIRKIHMLVIMDDITGEIKWHQSGPWVGQHDPDITAEGNIEVFNNRMSYIDQAASENQIPVAKIGSNIISFDPATNKHHVIYPRQDQPQFYTRIQGSHQLLDNGNRLIVESRAGRVFEIDSQGNIVWDYIKPYDDVYASWISHAVRYNKEYFKVSDWNCN